LLGFFALASSACSSDDEASSATPGPNPPGPTETGPTPQGTPDRDPLPDDIALPLVFVHGFAGSAQQYESQAIRFAANGYPRERIRAIDHDGAGMDYAGYANLVDALVDEVRTEFGVPKVYLVGHSRGTTVSSNYLGDPARAAKVAKYVSLDGRGCDAANTAQVPCVAPTQALIPGQAHVEVATSKESFAMQYKFLVGEDPAVVDIVRQDKPVVISGRAVNFPANTGRAGASLEIFEINAETGARLSQTPLKTFDIGDDGNWGPVEVIPEKRYEMALSAADTGTQHFYLQPYLRSSHFVRLLSGGADSPTRLNTNRGPDHAAIIAIRMREWYGDPNAAMSPRPADKMDELEIGTQSPGGDKPAVGVISPRMGNGAIAIHLHDDSGSPGESTLGELTNLTGCGITCVAFQTTADLFMPAADPPNGTITITNFPRGDRSKPQTLKVPNWASSGHIITLLFSDYAQ
jgi:pimeloyl-ACP methyl ester carboxylesterase